MLQEAEHPDDFLDVESPKADNQHPHPDGWAEEVNDMTQPLEHLSFEKADEVREGQKWRLELLNLAGGAQVGRITVQPGWKWSEHVKPVAGTELCMAPHQHYQVSGRMHVVMQDGTELESGPGEVMSLPPGHMPG